MLYVGLADCHGVESLMPIANNEVLQMLGEPIDESSLSLVQALLLRSRANRHRWAFVFKVELTDEMASLLGELLDVGEREEALTLLKKLPGLEVESWIASSLDRLPDPSLDPWRTGK